MKITAEHFQEATGHAPQQDDLERSNCPDAGKIGHDFCGWSKRQNKPMFMVCYREILEERAAELAASTPHEYVHHEGG